MGQLLPPQAPVDRLPDLNLSGMEAQVAEKIRTLHNQVRKNSNSASAWGKLAMNLAVHGLQREAVSCYRQAAALDPADFRWSYYCAVLLREMGSAEALDWLERSRSIKPKYAPLHVLYGQGLLYAGRLEEASQSFQQALTSDPQFAHAYLGLAQIALHRNDLQTSRRYLLEALKINPRYGEARTLLATVYRRLQDLKNAESELRQARELPSTTLMPDPLLSELTAEGVSSFWYEMRGRECMEKGLYEAAVREFEIWVKVAPDHNAHNSLGFALQKMGRSTEAIEQYRAAVALRPTSNRALNNLGSALFEVGKIGEAISCFEKALQLNPAAPEAYFNLGTFQMRAGDVEKAIETFRAGLRNASDNMRLAVQLAWLLATSPEIKLRSGAEAVRLAESVCEKTNYKVPRNLAVLAAAYAEAGQYMKAVETARQARQLAMSIHQLDLANQIQSQLKSYQAHRPYREKPF